MSFPKPADVPSVGTSIDPADEAQIIERLSIPWTDQDQANGRVVHRYRLGDTAGDAVLTALGKAGWDVEIVGSGFNDGTQLVVVRKPGNRKPASNPLVLSLWNGMLCCGGEPILRVDDDSVQVEPATMDSGELHPISTTRGVVAYAIDGDTADLIAQLLELGRVHIPGWSL